MSEFAIRAVDLGKEYRIGALQTRATTLGETLLNAARSPLRRARNLLRGEAYGAADLTESIWALRSVSFAVRHGEVLGVIGHNGSGKSTLLKILSRITEPSAGYAAVHGSVGALLEVGTGFHPELTGRENVYLNGAILGMNRVEIDRKFDEIVAFAEVERFVDTPVKHYSSGMRLRLGFAVAAHLEPDILVVDEVLAVGDASFRRKCMNRVSGIATEGRTVLFVSHDMSAIQSICDRVLVLQHGRVIYDGDVETGISHYLTTDGVETTDDLSAATGRYGSGEIRFTRLELLNRSGVTADIVQAGEAITIAVDYELTPGAVMPRPLHFNFFFDSLFGQRLFLCSTRFSSDFEQYPAAGRLYCHIPRLPLNKGSYRLSIVVKTGSRPLDGLRGVQTINVVEGDFFGTGKIPPSSGGTLLVDHHWQLEQRTEVEAGEHR